MFFLITIFKINIDSMLV